LLLKEILIMEESTEKQDSSSKSSDLEKPVLKSSFERSVCCVFSKTMCKKTHIYRMMMVFNTVIAITGGILILTNIPDDTTGKGFITGLILHGISLMIELSLSIYPVRYLIGMYDEIPNPRDKNIYLAKSYILCTLYIFFIIIASSVIHPYRQGPEGVLATNRSFVAILIFFGSFLVVSYWSMIISPTCTLHDKDKSQIFQDPKTSFNASLNLAIVFIVSFVVTNIGFGVYYADIILHYTLISTGMASMVTSIILQCIATYQIGDIGNVAFGVWFFAGIAYIISSIILFFLVQFKLQIDPLYPTFSYERNVYFIVQASFTFLFGALYIICIIIRLSKSFARWYKKTIPLEILKAQKKVEDLENKEASGDVVLEPKLYQQQSNDLE
jgi:hypothetical protein